MKKLHLLLILFTVAFNIKDSGAQDKKINTGADVVSVEEMIGDKRQYLQLMVNKVFVEKKGIGFLSISAYAADYKSNLNNNEFQSTALIYHHLFNGISVNSGASFTSFEGLKNFVGLQYVYQSKNVFLIYMPSYYFLNSSKISNLAVIDFKPSINENWSFYSRLQLHYNHDLKNGSHYRSYVYSRLGLTYKYFSFGLAHNYDRYRADKVIKNNYGVFLKLNL